MPRIRHIDRPKKFQVMIPESLYTRITLELFSELEGRVPYGKYGELVAELLVKWLREERGVQL